MQKHLLPSFPLAAALMGAALAALALAVLFSLSIGGMQCGANGSCTEVIASILVYAFPVCLIAVAILNTLAGKRQTPFARTAKSMAASGVILTKTIYVFVMVLALALTFADSPEPGMSTAIVIMVLMSAPAGVLVSLPAMEIMGIEGNPEGLQAVAVWLVLFATGWWQWFMAVPALHRWRHPDRQQKINASKKGGWIWRRLNPETRQKIKVSEEGGWSALMVAASEGDAGAVRQLLDKEARPDATPIDADAAPSAADAKKEAVE